MTQIQHLTSLFGSVHWRSIYFLPLLFGLLPLYIQFSQGISSFFPIKNVLRLIFFILLHLVILGPRPSHFPSIPIVFLALYRINPTTSFLLVRVVVFEGSCFIEFSFITVWFRVFSLYTTILYFFNEKQWVARANASRMKTLFCFFWIDNFMILA